MKYSKYKFKTHRVNGNKMLGYSNRVFNSCIANLEKLISSLVNSGDKFLALKDGKSLIKE